MELRGDRAPFYVAEYPGVLTPRDASEQKQPVGLGMQVGIRLCGAQIDVIMEGIALVDTWTWGYLENEEGMTSHGYYCTGLARTLSLENENTATVLSYVIHVSLAHIVRITTLRRSQTIQFLHYYSVHISRVSPASLCLNRWTSQPPGVWQLGYH